MTLRKLTMPGKADAHLAEASRLIAQLYEAQGNPAKAAEWRKKAEPSKAVP